MRRVINNRDVVRAGNTQYGVHVRRQAPEVDQIDGLGLGGDLVLDALRIDVQAQTVDVREAHLHPLGKSAEDGRLEGQRSRDDLVVVTQAKDLSGQGQRRRRRR